MDWLLIFSNLEAKFTLFFFGKRYHLLNDFKFIQSLKSHFISKLFQ